MDAEAVLLQGYGDASRVITQGYVSGMPPRRPLGRGKVSVPQGSGKTQTPQGSGKTY